MKRWYSRSQDRRCLKRPHPSVHPLFKPSRIAKLHVGGYYYPDDPIIVAFQKLGIDLRRSQQDMLLEAVRDFVAKYEATHAFNNQPAQRQLRTGEGDKIS